MFNLNTTSKGRTRGAKAGRTREAMIEQIVESFPGWRVNRTTIPEFIANKKLGISEVGVRKQLTLLRKSGIVYRPSKSPLEELGYEVKKRIRYPKYRIDIARVAELLVLKETEEFLRRYPATSKKQEETFKEVVRASVLNQFFPHHDFSLKGKGIEDFVVAISEIDRQGIIDNCMRAYDAWAKSKKGT